MTAVSTAAPAAPRPRSRLRARLVLAGLSACGLAALAWASFVHPLPRLTYNPSDSVAVGWYRIDPLDPRTASLPRPLSVGSIVLVPLPARAAALAAQRGYLPTRVPLLKRVGAVAPQQVCIVAAGPHRRRAFGRRAACRPAGPAAAILAAVPPPRTGRTVPAQRDQSGVVRQPVFRAGQRIRRDRRCASGLAGDTPMMAADSLHVAVHLIVPSGVSSGCRRVVARAVRAHSRRTSRCLRRSRPTCRRLASNAPGLRPSPRSPARWLLAQQRRRAAAARSDSEGQRRKARQRTRHRAASKASLHVGWRGTERLRRRAAWGARPAPMQACPRASHDRTRQSLQGAQP
jgi:hypothetical protein